MLLRRKIANHLFSAFTALSLLFGIGIMAAILLTLLSKGWAGFSLPIFSQSTPAPDLIGGLKNAIVGSLLMTFIGMLISAPIGILAAIYLIDSGRGTKLSTLIRFFNDILLSAPSIVIGLFLYVLVVRMMGHFSGWAGALALAFIALPIIVRTSEDVLLLASDPLREAATALGAPRWKVAWLIGFHAARSGIITALLLAMARIFGETAPLLFTALSNQFYTNNLQQPMANLPVVIFQFAMSPYENWQDLAWAGALLLTLSILLISIIARCLGQKRN